MSLKIRYQFLAIFFGILMLHPFTIWGQNYRETWQPPSQIMDSVGINPGMLVGEVGAGRGHFTFHLAQRVGESGKVYANDISRTALDALNSRAEGENTNNITTVLGKSDDPLFPEKGLDIIIMVYALHHVDTPVEMLKNLKKYMKPEARLVIIEKNTDKDRDAYPHFMSQKQVMETAHSSNFKQERIDTFLPRDIIYIYKLMD